MTPGGGARVSFFRTETLPEDGGSKLLQDFGKPVPDCTASHPVCLYTW